jgi:mRNA interferase MazF
MVSERAIEPYSVYLVHLEPTVGVEMNKARPCVVISPEVMHRVVRTVVIAPLTTHKREYPTRVSCRFAGRTGEVALDQLRSVDRSRLLKRLGSFDDASEARVREALVRMFGPSKHA